MDLEFVVPILLFVIALVVVRWILVRPKKVAVPDGASAGDIFLESRRLKIGGVTYQADCGTLVVPEKRANPVSRLTALPVKRIHASGPMPAEPIFYLSGGPGMSNMGFTPPAWLAQHDVVLIGYRGVDGSQKLDSPEFALAAHGLDGDLLSAKSLDNMGKAAAVCAANLKAARVDLDGYTIPEVVEDMENARVALGYGRIDLLSESYGTRVAQVYATMYPDSLLRSAMIGVNPPGHFVWLPETVDAQVAYYARLWRQAGGEDAPDLLEAMRSVNLAMPASWRLVTIDPGKVKAVAFFLLFHRSTAPMVFDAYLSAEKGDPSGLALMSTAYDLLVPGMMTWGEFLQIGYSADYQPSRDYRAELDKSGSTLGSPLALMTWGSLAGNWSTALIAEKYRRVQPSQVETLLISGSIDFSTPAQFGRDELLPSLCHGRQVIIAEQGHVADFWNFQTEAAERLLTSFYDTGKADDSLYTYLPMDFTPKLRFPTLAKIMLATGAFLILGLGRAALGIARRSQLHKKLEAQI